MPQAACSNQPGPVSHRSGERAPLVAEELALEQTFGHGRAVDGHERARPARVMVDGPGHTLAPGFDGTSPTPGGYRTRRFGVVVSPCATTPESSGRDRASPED